jgi:hypothetical protein
MSCIRNHEELLIDLTENDRTKLLLRNALQILNIVKAQFSHPVFRDSRASVSCKGTLSDEHELACAWKAASVYALDVAACSADPKTAISSLVKVNNSVEQR